MSWRLRARSQQWEANQIRRDLHARRAAANPELYQEGGIYGPLPRLERVTRATPEGEPAKKRSPVLDRIFGRGDR